MEELKELSDKELLSKAKGNDTKSFEALKHRYRATISATFRKLLSKGELDVQLSISPAGLLDDIESLVWTGVFKKSTFDWEKHPDLGGLIYDITSKRTIEIMRKSIRRRQQGDTEDNLQFPSYHDVEEEALSSRPVENSTPETINSAIDLINELGERLSEKQRTILDLQYAGMSQKDIAIKLDVSEKTVYNALQSIKAIADKVDA
ncbi:MAG: RNA polymerase sigma factor [Oleiphilus sp.]